jgi:hypothetical protein
MSGSGEINYENSFVMEYTGEGSGMQEVSSVTVRVDGQNTYMTLEGGQQIEVYYVDGESYQVIGERCFKGQDQGQSQVQPPGPVPQPGEEYDPTADFPEEPDRRETIDGEEMLVYTFTGPAYQGVEVTAYVSANTGYLRRIEGENWTVEYHSWGDVDPIEAPDMECQDVGGGGSGGDGGGYGGGSGSGGDN